jgi:hypothetical protein
MKVGFTLKVYSQKVSNLKIALDLINCKTFSLIVLYFIAIFFCSSLPVKANYDGPFLLQLDSDIKEDSLFVKSQTDSDNSIDGTCWQLIKVKALYTAKSTQAMLEFPLGCDFGWLTDKNIKVLEQTGLPLDKDEKLIRLDFSDSRCGLINGGQVFLLSQAKQNKLLHIANFDRGSEAGMFQRDNEYVFPAEQGGKSQQILVYEVISHWNQDLKAYQESSRDLRSVCYFEDLDGVSKIRCVNCSFKLNY